MEQLSICCSECDLWAACVSMAAGVNAAVQAAAAPLPAPSTEISISTATPYASTATLGVSSAGTEPPNGVSTWSWG